MASPENTLTLETTKGAVLRRISARLDLHLLHRFHHGAGGRGGDEIVHDADAVERHAVLDLARSSAVEILAGRHTGGGRLGPLQHTGRGERDRHGVAAGLPGQRQLREIGDDLRDRGVVGLDGGGSGLHRDRFHYVADFQRDVVAHHLVDIHVDAGHPGHLEPGLLDFQIVVADGHELKVVVSLVGRDGGVGIVGTGIDGTNLGAGHGLAAGIDDRSDERSGGGDLRADTDGRGE